MLTTPPLQVLPPAFRATSLLESTNESCLAVLSEHDRQQLSSIASCVHFKKGELLYEQGQAYEYLYILLDGAVKTYHVSPEGHCAILAFFMPEDIAGLGESGFYVNSAEAVEATTAYRLPIRPLEALMRTEAHLEMMFLCKACNELRRAQRHAIMLANHSARAKVALFINMLRQLPLERPDHIRLPMSRADVASFLGMSIEAVSRAFRGLEKDGVLQFKGPRIVGIRDERRFAELVKSLD